MSYPRHEPDPATEERITAALSRPRSKDSFPVHISDVDPFRLTEERPHFPFKSWAAANRFPYPPKAEDFLRFTQSAAEAFFVQPFIQRAGVAFPGGRFAEADGLKVELQAKCAGYQIDVLVTGKSTGIAVEIDGLTFHRMTKEQVAADYLRQRRILLRGYPVARFTAQEAFAEPDECWRQLEAILTAWSPR